VNQPDGLDVRLLDPTRLSLVAVLASTAWAEFPFVRDSVGLTDSALSKQVRTLEAAGYVTIKKGYIGKRPRTWLQLSAAGRHALRDHVAALQRIAQTVAEPSAEPDSQVDAYGRRDHG
jgi:DNA-binding MarR family transcriptional regulator